ncbi:MAG TPA: hypothetical protein VK159_12340 [Lacibacter sp.]|nr:hypothetical protein [Lacibacter sp.]
MKIVHAVIYNQGAFSFYNPGKLNFIMPMQVGVKESSGFIFNNNILISRNWYGELKNIHND